MQVYKFGGASIATPERMKALLPIIQQGKGPLIVVISALGKTTNALEAIVQKATNLDKEGATQLAQDLEQQHTLYCKELFSNEVPDDLKKDLNVLFTELQWAIEDADEHRYDYSYDQIVCIGELLSTKIFQHYAIRQGFGCQWLDARDVIRTDNEYRDPKVDLNISQLNAEKFLLPLLKNNCTVITQGFIGATDENNSVTLGREGSDYSAALFAYLLNGEAVTIWKDVEGLQNADPKLFSNTVKVEAITYHEVIEMAYYGAQVIHPKTIKPLQNKQIPLYIRSFENPKAKGTVVTGELNSIFYPPLIILKQNQTLLQVTTRDFSFITEDNLSNIYHLFHDLSVKVNLIQNAAISFVACINHDEYKVQQLTERLQKDFTVFRNEGVQLLTIRHYTPEILADLTRHKYILLEQKTRHNVQLVLK